jgi:Zn finger protein HypA/HybF involved in hydrogenase expression
MLAYDAEVQGTPLCGSCLDVDTDAPEAVCQQCGHRFLFDQAHLQCALCGSMRLALPCGEELILESMQMEDEP